VTGLCQCWIVWSFRCWSCRFLCCVSVCVAYYRVTISFDTYLTETESETSSVDLVCIFCNWWSRKKLSFPPFPLVLLWDFYLKWEIFLWNKTRLGGMHLLCSVFC
jgi:hypothetical protein